MAHEPAPLSIATNDARDRARLIYTPPPTEGTQTGEGLVTEALAEVLLDACKIRLTAARKDAIARALERIRAAPNQPHEFDIAHSLPAIDGSDGVFERVPLPASSPDAESHYERSSLTIVRAGTHLGTLIPPTAGTDGEDLQGRCHPCVPGRPAPITFNQNIRVEPDGRVVVARGGILREGEGSLEVDHVLRVPGPVDFGVGNLSFPGDVEVSGGILSGFSVEAEGSLRVHGLVEAATLSAGLDAELSSGMAAQGKGAIRVGRDLSATYADAGVLRVGRDLSIARELTNSRTTVGRDFHAPHASVIGGELLVSGNAALAALGSEGGARTHLVIGRRPELERVLASLVESMEAMAGRLARSRERLALLSTRPKRLTPTEAEELTTLEFEIARDRQRLGEVRARVERSLDGLDARPPSVLRVERAIRARSTIWIGTLEIEFTRDLAGPVELAAPPAHDPAQAIEAIARRVRGPANVEPSSRFLDLVLLRRGAERAADAPAER